MRTEDAGGAFIQLESPNTNFWLLLELASDGSATLRPSFSLETQDDCDLILEGDSVQIGLELEGGSLYSVDKRVDRRVLPTHPLGRGRV